MMMSKVYIFDLVNHRSTNYGQEIAFVNKVLLLHCYTQFNEDCLWLLSHDGVVTTDTTWPAEIKILTI